ncbi:MAG TPA: hypothetical protein DD706_13845 [Nitrospiraceae bacterium]|nr:hypothetical protein [Nitrospiraceae bacterium]
MFLEVEQNQNFESSYFMRFKEIGPPRQVSHVKSYDRTSKGEWCSVTGWCDDPDQSHCPAYAQKVEDSGAGSAFIVFGGNWGIRLKLESDTKRWSIDDPNQWGEGYLLLGEERDIRYM